MIDRVNGRVIAVADVRSDVNVSGDDYEWFGFDPKSRTMEFVISRLTDRAELAIRSRVLINNNVLFPDRWRAISFRTHSLTISDSSSFAPSSDVNAIFIHGIKLSEDWVVKVAYLMGDRVGNFVE